MLQGFPNNPSNWDSVIAISMLQGFANTVVLLARYVAAKYYKHYKSIAMLALRIRNYQPETKILHDASHCT